MSALEAARPAAAEVHAAPRPRVEVVVPVRDEERDLERCVRRLHAHLRTASPWPAQVVIADSASTDATPEIAARLAAELDGVRVVTSSRPGRGRALRAAWLGSRAEVVAYMDADLSTDLNALVPLLAPLLSGHSELAIGTRLARGARVRRGVKRELISRAYNHLLRLCLRARFSDAQCGFKALRTDTARRLLPLVRDEAWFFDTELLVLAQRLDLRVHEVPVDWTDDPDSSVDLLSTALQDLRGIGRLAWRWPGLRFAAIGGASTLAHLALFLALRGPLGAGAANAVALALTAVANTQANRRVTFGVRGRADLVRHQAQGLLVLLLTLGLGSLALWTLEAADPDAAGAVQAAVLVAANLAATVTRYVAMRSWIFARADGGPGRTRVRRRGRSARIAACPPRCSPSTHRR